MPVVRHEECWAKTDSDLPGISVEQHCRTAGIIARLLAECLPSWLVSHLGVRNGVVLAALHDVGKVAPNFQCKCTAWSAKHKINPSSCCGQESDHAKIGQKTVQDLLRMETLKCWAMIVGAHHGCLKSDWVRSVCAGGTDWDAERARLANGLVAEFGPLPVEEEGLDTASVWFNAGLIAVADWLASDERFFPPSKVMTADEILARAVEQLATIGFAPFSAISARKFADLFPFEPNELQTVLANAVKDPGVYVVEASMGSGKTEAALGAAYNLLAGGQARGIYFALPTRTTSNRIHQRMADFVGRLAPGSGTRLIHSGSWLLDLNGMTGRQQGDEKAGEGQHDGRDWFASSRRALLAPFGVGTVDQALLGAVAARHFFVRQFGLAGKVVILDEVHSYDLYTGTLLDGLIRRLRDLGATVIVLSATLTAARRRELLSEPHAQGPSETTFPLVSGSVAGQCRQWAVPTEVAKRVGIHFRAISELMDACCERAERGECVVWIRNTVNEAQDAFKALKGRIRDGGPEVALLHARFPQFRREALESAWLDRLGKNEARRPTRGCILVATQVAEQSVDIDADLLVTDLAPTDMMLQRLGRLWRHERKRPAGCEREAWVALPGLDLDALRAASVSEIKAALGKGGKVYAPYVLLRSFALWRGRRHVVIPSDMRELLEGTYSEATGEPDAWRTLFAEMNQRKEKMASLALVAGNPFSVPLDDQEGVQTRWGGCPTVSLVLARHVDAGVTRNGAHMELLDGSRCAVRSKVFDYKAAKAIHRNLVTVPRWCLREYLGSAPDLMREYVQGSCVLAVVTDAELTLPDGTSLRLEYREDLGIVIPEWRNSGARRAVTEDDDESYDW